MTNRKFFHEAHKDRGGWRFAYADGFLVLGLVGRFMFVTSAEEEEEDEEEQEEYLRSGEFWGRLFGVEGAPAREYVWWW